MIQVVGSPTERPELRTIAIDSDLRTALTAARDHADGLGAPCVGVMVEGELQAMFWQEMLHVVSLDDMADLDELATFAQVADAVVAIGPSALLGRSLDVVVARIRALVPEALIICATGVRTDLPA